MDKFYVGTATKKLTCSNLSINEKVDIVHEALVKMVPYAIIASKYNVKPTLVSYLAGQVRKNPEFLRQKMANLDTVMRER